MTDNVQFAAKAVRTIQSPTQESVTTYFAYVNFRDLPENLPLEVNPRKPKMNTGVGKALKEAVESPDTDFDINNRGIVIVAKSFKFDNTNSLVTLDLGGDPENYGILDGGHTYTAIISNRDSLVDIDKYVRLEIIVGEDLTVSRIADARNTSASVSDIALFELDDKFDFIKKAVKFTPYANDVAIKDNSPERLPIIELLKLLFIYNNRKFSRNEMPIQAYSGKAAVFKDIKLDLDQKTNIYEDLSSILTDLVELYDYIETDYKNKFYAAYPGGRFGAIRGVEGQKANKKRVYRSLFLQNKLDYKISVGYILPVFGAFRVLVKFDETTRKFKWVKDPKKMWDKIGSELVKNTLDSSRNNPQDAGKNAAIWSNNYSKVENELFRELLETTNV